MENKNFLSSPVVVFVLVLLVLCCCCIVIVSAGTAGLFLIGDQQVSDGGSVDTPFDFSLDPATPTAVPVPRVPVENIPTDTLMTLEETIVPVNDPRELACRLAGKCDVPETLPSGPYGVGEAQKFWVNNTDTNENFQVDATLRYVTDHSYFWIQDGVKYNERDLKNLAEAFETRIYPTNREFFGSEWSPGVDEDPHVYVLFARGLGGRIAGYYSSADEYHPLAHEYSNAHEMFVFNADNTTLDDNFTYGVLSHEFQHMIHWHLDRNETSWLNEGFSELATLLNDYDPGGFDSAFIANPDLQLNDWPNDPSGTTPHYGAGFLFTSYFLDRFGEQATQTLVRSPINGMDSVDATLAEIGATDPLTGQPIQADDLFADWAVANYLDNPKVADGRFTYVRYTGLEKAKPTETLGGCPVDNFTRTVNQYGTDYVRITCDGTYTLHFAGATQTRLLPEDAYSGRYAFWSNKGDESDMTLTREFDFTDAAGPLTLDFQTWYDLEEDYDYLYLEASSDGGKTWQILLTPSGTGEDPSGNAYGWGYNGKTDGWMKESVDLSQFAGQKVQIRFEYVTDAAVNGEGLLLDDVSIPEIGYFTDFETDTDGWVADGFVRIENVLPQTFRVTLISKGKETTVQNITLNPDQTADISVEIGGAVDEVTLVVSGTTRFTRERASYSMTIK